SEADGNGRKNQAGWYLHEILVFEAGPVAVALDHGIDGIEHEGDGEEDKEPVTTLEEEILIAIVFGNVGGREQGGKQEQGDRVDDEEQCDGEGPLFEPEQREFPPPEQNQFHQNGDNP